jgi:hypothetical protein
VVSLLQNQQKTNFLDPCLGIMLTKGHSNVHVQLNKAVHLNGEHKPDVCGDGGRSLNAS